MRTLILALTLLAAGPALADECDAKASRIAEQVGGTIRTRMGPAIKMQHEEATNFSVNCKGSEISRVSGSKDEPGSIAGFAALIARTSSLGLGVPETAARGVMLQCIRSAAAKAGTIAEARGSGLKVECYVLGDYVTFDVTRR